MKKIVYLCLTLVLVLIFSLGICTSKVVKTLIADVTPTVFEGSNE